jgi:hypothetical protein
MMSQHKISAYDVNLHRVYWPAVSLAQLVKGFGFEPMDPRTKSHRWSGIFQNVLFRTLHFGENISNSRQDKMFIGK